MKPGAVENEGEAGPLKSWGVGPRERSLCPCWTRLQLWKKVNVFAQRCHESQPSLVTATGVGAGGLSISVHFYLGKGAPLAFLAPRFLSP